jgi:glycosyltransferase involved in cell wall biosynthesis
LSAAKITVFIPTFNRARYLRQSLKALEQQKMFSSELVVIVSDNASEDDTPKVVEEFPTLELEYWRNTRNLGPVANFNRVLELCRTEFVVLLPDDVLLAPGFLERAVDSLSQNPNATMYATAALVVQQLAPEQMTHKAPTVIVTPFTMMPRMLWPLQLQVYDYELWAAACMLRPPIYTGAAAFRYSFLSKIMPSPEDLPSNADRLWYFEAGRQGQVLFDPWIGASAVIDGHNLGYNLSMDAIRTEYRRVTQYIIEETKKDGIDVLEYWKNNLHNYFSSEQSEILSHAALSLTEETYVRTFRGLEQQREQQRTPKLTVRRLLRALQNRLKQR